MQRRQDPPSPVGVGGDIPLDVLEVIFTSLSPHDLAICCRVNKAVSALAHAALYRDLRPTQRNVLHICLKLCNDLELANRVRSFVLNDNNVDMYLGVINEVLPRLPRLNTLVLNIGHASSWILPTNASFQLTTLICTFMYDPPLTAFLNTQPTITRLTISSLATTRSLRAPSISPQFLPRLTSICAPFYLVSALVPGRPVRDVATSLSPNIASVLPVAFLSRTRARAGVERLALNFRSLQIVQRARLAEAAPRLRHLTIEADGVKPDDEEMLDELTEWVEEFVSYANHLDCLTIRFYPMLSRVPCQELDFSDMITSIFAASPVLRHVIITFYAIKAKYVCQRLPGHDWYILDD